MRTLIISAMLLVSISNKSFSASKNNDSLILDFIKQLELAMQYGNYSYLDSVIFMDSLINRVIIDSDDYTLRQFNAGFKIGLKSGFKLGKEIGSVVEDAGLYNYISYRVKDDSTYHIIYRLFGSQGINYHDFEVKIINDKPRIVDLFVYISGENISKTIKDNYLAILQQKGLINSIDKSELIEVKDILASREVKDLYNNGKIKKAYKKLNQTSEQFKKGKLFFVLNSTLLAELDENQYLLFLKKYSPNFKDDPFAYLLSLDFLYLKEEYEQLLSNLDILDKAVGGDPLLDFYRGNAYLEMGDYNQSLICYTRVKEEFPLYSYGYVGEVFTYVADEDYKTGVNLLKDIMDIFDFSTKEIETVLEDYPDFLASKEFKDWKKNY